MSVNILLGIGGTGAKVAEAIIHAVAAGLGPNELAVGFVDQDESNGNTTRARGLVSAIQTMRSEWRRIGGAHFIAGGGPAAADIQLFDSDDGLWTPHSDKTMTLSRIFGPMNEDRPMFDALFERGEIEQEMPLRGGYQGRPHIGSAAITAAIEAGQDPFWHKLNELIQRAANGQEVRLLLTGSAFGGTGAAGFPTIARLIRSFVREAGVEANFRMAGVLMLPYFGFSPPAHDATGVATNVARSEELLVQSRGALRYYHALFRSEKVFDELYLVGWNKLFTLNYHAPNNAGQANPALLPELIAALGACRFFVEQPTAARADADTFVSSRGNEDLINWADLPSPQDARADAPYKVLGQTLRFAVAWKHFATLISQKPGILKSFFGGQTWYQRQRLDKVKDREGGVDAAVNAMTAYVDAVLTWAACLQSYSTANHVDFNLWDMAIAVEPIDTSNPAVPPVVRAGIPNDQLRQAYAGAAIAPRGTDDPPTTTGLFSYLTNRCAPGAHAGLGQMVASLYDGSSVDRVVS